MNEKTHHKIQITTKRTYHIFKELLPLAPPTDERGQRLHLILTKAYQKSWMHFSEEREEPYIYFSHREAILLGGRSSYKEYFQLLITLGFLVPILKYNHHNRKQPLLTFKPIMLKPLRHNEKISHQRINTSIEGYYNFKKKNLTDVVNRYLVPYLRNIKFDFTKAAYYGLVGLHYSEYVKEFQQYSKDQKKQPLDYQAYMDNHQHLYNKLLDFNIAEGDAIYDHITQDRFSGRIHTPVTIFPKYLKNMNIIKYDGEAMTELDVKTFQPLLLAIILGDSDFSRWYFSVEDCYVAIQEKFKLISRDFAKVFMYQLMFGTTYGRYHNMFCEEFSEAGITLTKWKSTLNPENPNSYKLTKKGIRKSNYHSNISFLMQREEVKYMRMIWGMLGRKNIPFVTIHDAVLVPTSKAGLAEKYITEKFLVWFRGKASIRRRNLTLKNICVAA